MIITVTSTGVAVEQFDDLTTFKVLTGCDRSTTASVLVSTGAGRLVDQQVEVAQSYVLSAATAAGVSDAWSDGFEAMLSYAAGRGWVTSKGDLLAHVEWRTPAIESRVFRDALGHYASGITIISTMGGDEPAGFTCQSFYSVSTDPPLVSFSVMTNSTTYPLVREAGRFAVNVLGGHQHEISNQFARKGTDKWAGIEWTPSATGNPLIADTLMWLDCTLMSEHPAGDHFIVVGEVLGLSPADWHRHEPLLYFKGAYRHLSTPK